VPATQCDARALISGGPPDRDSVGERGGRMRGDSRCARRPARPLHHAQILGRHRSRGHRQWPVTP